MPARKNTIVLSQLELSALVDAITIRLSVRYSALPRYTRNKEAPIYTQLSDIITQASHMRISESTLCNIMTLQHSGRFAPDVYNALMLFIGNPFKRKESP